jgi:hypothetical protein
VYETSSWWVLYPIELAPAVPYRKIKAADLLQLAETTGVYHVEGDKW